MLAGSKAGDFNAPARVTYLDTLFYRHDLEDTNPVNNYLFKVVIETL